MSTALTRWKGKTALVTGASAGIGTAFARLLAEAGCDLVLTARRRERLEGLQAELSEKHGVTVDVVPEDLSDPAGPQRLFDAVQEAGKAIELLVNNAGYGVSGRFVDNDWDAERRMLQLNMISLAELTKLFLPQMTERRSGDVLLVSSIGYAMPVPTFAAYAATKAFVTRFGEALGYELRGTGVRVTVLQPGGTLTEFLDVAGMNATKLAQKGSMSAAAVAKTGLRAMAAGRRSITAGFFNKLAVLLTPLLPLGLRLRAAELFQRLAGGNT